MCRLDGRIRTKQERQQIIDRFTTDLSITLFLLTTQVHNPHSQQSIVVVFVADALYFRLELKCTCHTVRNTLLDVMPGS